MKNICLTMDVCDDSEGWDYLEQLTQIRERFKEAASSVGRDLKITWFPRCDATVYKWFGSSTALLEHPCFKEFEKAGDEIGFHPHFERDGVQCKDGLLNSQEAREILPLARKVFPDISSSRVGRLFMDNHLLATLADLGIKQDANCLPGRKETRDDMTFDWEPSPSEPYYPSKADYRVGGEAHLEILEIPYSMMPIKSERDESALMRYANIAFHSELFQGQIFRLCSQETIVLIAHPFEFLPHRQKSHLAAYDIEAGVSNLLAILQLIGECKFLTLRDLRNPAT